MRALSVAATGMMAQQLNVEVISNNIANMTTTGFKRRRAEFQDLLYQSQRQAGAQSSEAGTVIPAGVQLGLGVKAAAVYRVNGQGDLVGTENRLDLAIQGDGFFVIETPGGEPAFTRSGNFQLDPDGAIVTADGYRVSPAIIVPAEAVELAISAEGQVSAKLQGQVGMMDLGRLDLATFVNPAGLEATGNNLLRQTEASGEAILGAPGSAGLGTVLQGFLEGSNVNPVQEITALIAAQRAYDMNSKVISASDEMMATTTQLR